MVEPPSRLARPAVIPLPPPLAENPYQRLLYDHLRLAGVEVLEIPRFRVGWLWAHRHTGWALHFHWPQSYYWFDGRPARLRGVLSWVRLCAFAVRLLAARALGFRVVWTVHQVVPHDSGRRTLDVTAGRLLGRLAHRLIAHDAWTRERALAELGCDAEKIAVIPHGSYHGVYPRGRERQEVRRSLGIPQDAFVVILFGTLRRYKDTSVLLDALPLSDRQDIVVVVAGAPTDRRVEAAVRAAARADSRITPLCEHIPDERVAELFDASDVALATRGDGGTSGALLLALSLGLPTIAADCPNYRELTGDGAAGWHFAPRDPSSLAASLHAARDATPAELAERRRAAAERVAGLDWTAIAADTARVLFDGRPV